MVSHEWITMCGISFVQVRDGAHGFSKSLGKFCGKNVPDIITSSDRFLWLHFKSDENIEYQGFKAVYEFVPRPDSGEFWIQSPFSRSSAKHECFLSITVIEIQLVLATAALYDDMECGGTIDSSDEGFVNSSFISKEKIDRVLKHNLHLECMWMIKVREGFKVSSLLLGRERKRNSISVVVAEHFRWHFHSTLTIFFFFYPFLFHRSPIRSFYIFAISISRSQTTARAMLSMCSARELTFCPGELMYNTMSGSSHRSRVSR